MPTLLRIALPALLGASLGCARPTPTPEDAGPNAPRAAPPTRERSSAQATGPTAPGALVGRVLLRKPPPVLPPLPTSPSARSVCGTAVSDNAIRVDAAGGVADAVVWVDASPDGAAVAAGPAAVLDQRGCLYWPPVLAARAGGPLRIRNSDPLTHTVHGYGGAGGQSVFNVAMPLEHMELTRTLPPGPGVVDIRCDVHPWMRATVRTFDHAHFTTSGADGRFQLPGLPAGDVQLHAWHPRLGEASQRLKVGEGATAVELELGGAR